MSTVIQIPQRSSSGGGGMTQGSPVTGAGTNEVLYTDASGNLKTSANLLYTETLNYLQLTGVGAIIKSLTFESTGNSTCFFGGISGGSGLPYIARFSSNTDDGIPPLLLEASTNDENFVKCWSKDQAQYLTKIQGDGSLDFIGVYDAIGDQPLIWFTQSQSAPSDTSRTAGWMKVKTSGLGECFMPFYQ